MDIKWLCDAATVDNDSCRTDIAIIIVNAESSAAHAEDISTKTRMNVMVPTNINYFHFIYRLALDRSVGTVSMYKRINFSYIIVSVNWQHRNE